jgi:predicted translin family RNA/ssDNA-binding protein
MTIELSEDELSELRRVVDEFLENIHEEAKHTDYREYREGLRREETLIRGLRLKLEGDRVHATAASR